MTCWQVKAFFLNLKKTQQSEWKLEQRASELVRNTSHKGNKEVSSLYQKSTKGAGKTDLFLLSFLIRTVSNTLKSVMCYENGT